VVLHHHYAKFLSKLLEARLRYRDFWNFQDGGRSHVGFLTVEKVKKVEVHQCAKFRRNWWNRGREAYVNFNIMLVWLENAYSRPFLSFFGAHFHQMMSLIVLTFKRTILGPNHVI